jgi:transcriptional regulator with GAF, ATPase, and Fis domain
MQPGDKTRVPLRTNKELQEGINRQLMLTVVFHPDLTRIGASMTLGSTDSFGALRLVTSVVGREAPLLSDDKPLDERHVSRRALKLKHHARGVLISDTSAVSHLQLGPDKSSSMAVTLEELEAGLSVRFGHAIVCWLRLVPHPQLTQPSQAQAFTGISPESARVRQLIEVAANCDLPVLLRGQTGVGKEVVARTIHERSPRSSKPMVAVNMAALPETLADSELFGVAKGAFTGAERRSGYFKTADQATLFLDEVGELPISLQPKLLRALQEGEVQVVGGVPEQVDVRIIAATDANLDDAERFKQPLLQRLAGITINVPPLTSRREDIGLLLMAMGSVGNANAVPLRLDSASASPYAAAAWAGFVYDALNNAWPGNIRELSLAAQRFAITLADRADHYRASPATPTTQLTVTDDELLTEHEAANFEIAETARRLGLSWQAIYRRLEQIPEVTVPGRLPDRTFLRAVETVGDDVDALSRYLKVSRVAVTHRLRQLGVLS